MNGALATLLDVTSGLDRADTVDVPACLLRAAGFRVLETFADDRRMPVRVSRILQQAALEDLLAATAGMAPSQIVCPPAGQLRLVMNLVDLEILEDVPDDRGVAVTVGRIRDLVFSLPTLELSPIPRNCDVYAQAETDEILPLLED